MTARRAGGSFPLTTAGKATLSRLLSQPAMPSSRPWARHKTRRPACPGPPRLRRPKLPDEPCAPPPKRAWGWAIQLYALRSRESWGVGDLADLRRFGRWSRRNGGSIVLLNPLGAQTPTLPYQPSPYYSSSRRFRNFIYLRIEEIDGAERCTAGLEPLRAEALKLNQERL